MVTINTSWIAKFAQATNYICLMEEQPSGTEGGTFTQDAWQTRILNTEQADYGNHCTLSNNQFILDPGVYICHAIVTAWHVANHRCRLRNVTNGVTLLVGSSAYSNAAPGVLGSETLSHICGIFEIGSNKALELQHRCTTTQADNGFGRASGYDEIEVYSMVWFIKVA